MVRSRLRRRSPSSRWLRLGAHRGCSQAAELSWSLTPAASWRRFHIEGGLARARRFTLLSPLLFSRLIVFLFPLVHWQLCVLLAYKLGVLLAENRPLKKKRDEVLSVQCVTNWIYLFTIPPVPLLGLLPSSFIPAASHAGVRAAIRPFSSCSMHRPLPIDVLTACIHRCSYPLIRILASAT